MSLNILISISILKQQSNLTTIFDTYFTSLKFKYDNKELLKLLNSYRTMFKMTMLKDKLNGNNNVEFKSSIIESELEMIKVETVDESVGLPTMKIEDYYFNRNLIDELRTNHDHVTEKKFYEPRVLIENKEACRPRKNENGRASLFMICLIHSHINNYLRRKTMRDTWLSMNRIKLAELYPDVDLTGGGKSNYNDVELHIEHLFVIGQDRERPEAMQLIKNESNAFNDILMIDTEENYKNLLYKHLALINWVIIIFMINLLFEIKG